MVSIASWRQPLAFDTSQPSMPMLFRSVPIASMAVEAHIGKADDPGTSGF